MEDQINFESRIDFTDLNEKITRIRERMGKMIIGQKEVADLLLTAMLADGHILIEGVPGIAKTLMAKVMARMLDVTFNRIQFTPDLMPSDILEPLFFFRQQDVLNTGKGLFSRISCWWTRSTGLRQRHRRLCLK